MDESGTIEAPAVTDVRPTAGSCYSHGWGRMWKYFLELLLIIIVLIVASIPVTWLSVADTMERYEGFLLKFFAVVYSVMLLAPLEYGLSYAFLRAARGEKLEVKDMIAPFYNYFNAVLANLLVDIVIGVGILLFIIPGIYFACRLAFVPYLVVDGKLDAIEAFKESWRMTRGHSFEIFMIGLLAAPIAIAGLILFGIGVIISSMWIGLALASMYYAVAPRDESALRE